LVAAVAFAVAAGCAAIVGIDQPFDRAADAGVDGAPTGDTGIADAPHGDDGASGGDEPLPDVLSCSDGSTPCGVACCAGLTSACLLDDAGVDECVPQCSSNAECPNRCCAPIADQNGNPVGPFVCKPADGQPYDCAVGSMGGCMVGGTTCAAGFCILNFVFASDASDVSCQCVKPCAPDAGPAQCGGAVCEPFQGAPCNGLQGFCDL